MPVQDQNNRLKQNVIKAVSDFFKPENICDIQVIPDNNADTFQILFTLEVNPQEGAQLEPLRKKAEDAVRALQNVSKSTAILTAERPRNTNINSQTPQLKQPVRKSPQFSHQISSRPVAPKVRSIIAVASGKGGVGKSTVSANLAAACQAMGLKTGLLDADIYGASQPLMMGVQTKPDTDQNGMIIPLTAHGIKVMSMGFFVDPEAPVVWRGPMVHSAIQQLFRDVAWGDLDVLIVDLPPGTGDAQLSLAQNVPLAGAIIVSTPQEAAMRQARKGAAMFEKTNVPVLGLIENMSHYACGNCGHIEHIFDTPIGAAAAQDMKTEYLGDIPLLPALRDHADRGQPFVTANPTHPAATAIRNIAARVVMKLQQEKPAREKTAS